MKVWDRKIAWCLAGTVVLLMVSGIQSAVSANEYYSWVTSSGEMVLTDDSGLIPPASARGPVSVHHYQDRFRPSPPRSAAASTSVHTTAPEPEGLLEMLGDSEAPALMDVLIDPPEQGVAGDYDWVPLASPAYYGSVPIYGFWSNRRVTNPSAAWAGYLRKLQQLAPVAFQHHRPRHSGRSSASYTQLVRGRHPVPFTGMSQAIDAPFSSPRCCPLTHQSASGRRSASRR